VAIPDLIIPDFYNLFPVDPIEDEKIIFAEILFDALELDDLQSGQKDLLNHCEKTGDRFALLDSPRGSTIKSEKNAIDSWPRYYQSLPESKCGALYYPWIKHYSSDIDGHDFFIPPSGHIAGVYARTDRQYGIAKAPANESLRGVVDLEFNINAGEQDVLNPQSVNCLRSFPGRGLFVWGARTMSLDASWRYVNIRRMYLSIVKHISTNLKWSVFEPSDSRLWAKIVATLTQFFNRLLENGLLAGTTTEDAFFIKCDHEINSAEVVDRGEVIIQVGFAPIRPAEFILLTITRAGTSFTVSA
jgi:hypothetical protein